MSDQYKERPVRVEFPSEMKVYSPKTDQQLDGIKKSFLALFDFLEKNFNTMINQTGVLKEMPAMFSHLEKVIQNQFEMSFLQQFEATIMSHHAEALSDETKIEALQSFLEKTREHLEESLNSVRERYKKLLTQVAENNSNRRQELDNHAYALLQEVYPSQIQDRFSNISVPAYSYLSAHAIECAQARTAGLINAFKQVRQEVEEFLAAYRNAVSQIEAMVHHDISPGSYRVSFKVVEVEDINTGKKRLVFQCGNGDSDLPEKTRTAIEHSVAKRFNRLNKTPIAGNTLAKLSEELKSKHRVCHIEIERLAGDNIAWGS